MAETRVWVLPWLESGEMIPVLDTIGPDLREALEEAGHVHPEFLLFLANPNATIENVESLAARRKRHLQSKRKDNDNGKTPQ